MEPHFPSSRRGARSSLVMQSQNTNGMPQFNNTLFCENDGVGIDTFAMGQDGVFGRDGTTTQLLNDVLNTENAELPAFNEIADFISSLDNTVLPDLPDIGVEPVVNESGNVDGHRQAAPVVLQLCPEATNAVEMLKRRKNPFANTTSDEPRCPLHRVRKPRIARKVFIWHEYKPKE